MSIGLSDKGPLYDFLYVSHTDKIFRCKLAYQFRGSNLKVCVIMCTCVENIAKWFLLVTNCLTFVSTCYCYLRLRTLTNQSN